MRLFFSCFVLVSIFFASFATARWTENITNSYIQRLEYAEKLSDKEHWQEAQQITQEVYQDWQNRSFPLYTLLRHSDLDKIMVCFQSVSQYVELQDKEPYTANNAQLIAQLRLLAEMEQLSLENIL